MWALHRKGKTQIPWIIIDGIEVMGVFRTRAMARNVIRRLDAEKKTGLKMTRLADNQSIQEMPGE